MGRDKYSRKLNIGIIATVLIIVPLALLIGLCIKDNLTKNIEEIDAVIETINFMD